MRVAAYTPSAVPTMLSMNAVIIPPRSPSHQPSAPPTVAPTMPRSFFNRAPGLLTYDDNMTCTGCDIKETWPRNPLRPQVMTRLLPAMTR